MPTRVEAYLAALSKTKGRCFDFTGQPILNDEEREVLRAADLADFTDAFKRHIVVVCRLKRLEQLDRLVGHTSPSPSESTRP